MLYGQFWPPGMNALSEDCKWYQYACINLEVCLFVYIAIGTFMHLCIVVYREQNGDLKGVI